MKKEHFKNLVLIVLIITNFMLSQRIFANKKLWLFGYNFFANMGNSLKSDEYLTALHLAHPEKIFINTGYQSSRFVYSRGFKDFNSIYELAEPVIISAFSQKSSMISETTKDEWFSVLSGKSIYLSFGSEYSTSVYSMLLGISQTEIPVDSFSHIVINENGNLYIMDSINNKYYRIHTQSYSISTAIEDIMNQNPNADSVINYSYELNFDKDFGDQKTFISPMVPIYSSPLYSSTVYCNNPIIRSDEVNSGIIDKILSVFSFNPSTVRKYTEADGTIVYVENNGVLRISENGVINFTANDTGILLEGSNQPLLSIAKFIDNINSATGMQTDMSLTSAITADTKNFTFDYIINGYPIKFDTGFSVNATISNGYLKEYTHILRNFTLSQTQNSVPMFIESLDNTILSYQGSMNRIHIIEMYPAYSAGLGETELFPDWHIEINNVVAE